MAKQKMTNLICLVAIAMITAVKMISAINCYDCNFCNSVDNTTKVTNCTVSCRTYNVHTFGKNITWRGCSNDNYTASNPCDMKFSFLGYENVQKCLCNKDLCNNMQYSAGSAIKFSFTLAVFGLLSALLFKVV